MLCNSGSYTFFEATCVTRVLLSRGLRLIYALEGSDNIAKMLGGKWGADGMTDQAFLII